MLGAERLDAHRTDGRLVRGKVVRFKVLARVAAVRRDFAAEGAAHLTLTGRLRVTARQVVEVIRVAHYDLIRA